MSWLLLPALSSSATVPATQLDERALVEGHAHAAAAVCWASQDCSVSAFERGHTFSLLHGQTC